MSRRGQKKVAVWKYVKDTATLDVTVYMVEVPKHECCNDGLKAFFRVQVCDLGIDLTNSDINALRVELWKELDAKLAIKWTDWLYVEVDGDVDLIVRKRDPDDDRVEDPLDLISRKGGCNVSISYERLQLGELSGQKMQRYWDNYHEGKTYYDTPHTGWPEVGKLTPSENPRWWDLDERKTRCLIPDTIENRAALDVITGGFKSLLNKLHVLLSPENAQKTLTGGQQEYRTDVGVAKFSGETK